MEHLEPIWMCLMDLPREYLDIYYKWCMGHVYYKGTGYGGVERSLISCIIMLVSISYVDGFC